MKILVSVMMLAASMLAVSSVPAEASKISINIGDDRGWRHDRHDRHDRHRGRGHHRDYRPHYGHGYGWGHRPAYTRAFFVNRYYPAPVVETRYVYLQPAFVPPPQGIAQNRYCREYQGTALINGYRQSTYGTACQQPDGAWEIVN